MTTRPTWTVSALILATGTLVSALAFAEPATQPSGAAPTTNPSAMPADKLLDQMLKPTVAAPKPLKPVTEAPAIDRTTGTASIAPGAEQMTVLREGSYIRDRVGRLTKSADGQTFEFTFDSDGAALKDPPVVILPNLKLMSMENAVSAASLDLKFRITGMVTEYKQRNYVLLDKVVVVDNN